MLLAVYGLRDGEVRRLQLADFDWQNERLCVTRGKTRSVQIYPLTRPVGDAVLRSQGRSAASSHREVFLTLRAPFRPLGNAAVGCVVARRLHALGISPPHFGSSLRHACATHLLDEGLSLKEIGDHLGHRDPDTSCQGEPHGLAASRRLRPGRLAMNLHQLIERYVSYRQALGERCCNAAIPPRLRASP